MPDALVVVMTASDGDHEAGLAPRLTWPVAMGVMAAGLLFAGGLTALQTAAIVTGLPFAVVLLVIAGGTIKLIHDDLHASKQARPKAKCPGQATAETRQVVGPRRPAVPQSMCFKPTRR